MKKLMMAVMMAVALVAWADDFSFTYQAELKDAKGGNLASQNQTVEIRLWKTAATSAEGDLLWGRTYNIYTDKNGLFNQEISDSAGSLVADWPSGKTVLPLSTVFCNNDAGMVYIGLKVKDSSGEIVPRQRLFAVPFAGRANSANNLVGDTHNVEGKLKLGSDSSLSPSGLTLPASSSSTLGSVTAESLTCKNGDVAAGNVNFTGKLTSADGSEIIPVPVGGIIMWTKDTLPDDEHWAICDGSTSKSGVKTPDLRGRFVVGVGTCKDSKENSETYAAGETGGFNKHELSTDEMPNHRHHLGNGSDWWHVEVDDSDDYGFSVPYAYKHGHNIQGSSGKDSNGDTSYVGGGKAHENRPPYYALYYIMRVK